MAEPIDMLFGVLGLDGPKESCIRWGLDTPWEVAILRGKGRPIVKCRDALA